MAASNVIRLERRKAPGYPMEAFEIVTALDAVLLLQRELRGENVHKIAYVTGLHPGTVAGYQRGDRSNPPLESVIRLCRALGFAVRIDR